MGIIFITIIYLTSAGKGKIEEKEIKGIVIWTSWVSHYNNKVMIVFCSVGNF